MPVLCPGSADLRWPWLVVAPGLPLAGLMRDLVAAAFRVRYPYLWRGRSKEAEGPRSQPGLFSQHITQELS